MNSCRSLCNGFIFKADFACQRKINICIRTKSSIFGKRDYDFLFEPFKKVSKK